MFRKLSTFIACFTVTWCNITEYSDMNKEKENKNAEISARIAEILDYFSESKNAFALKLGYERAQTVYDIINGKSAPSYDFFKKFQFSEYSEMINTDWLLTGRGSMLKGDDVSQMSDKAPTTTSLSSEPSVYYNMYKEKDKEVKSLAEQLGALKYQIKILKEKIEELQLPSLPNVASAGSTQIHKSDAADLESVRFARR